ncbi:MAG: SLC13 family permease, partial [Roseiflexaceae bacterium]
GLVVGLSPAVAVALATASLLLQRRTSATALLAPIDGSLLLFFAALFVVTAALRTSASAQLLFAWASTQIAGQLGLFAVVTAILSNLISNVPAVLVLAQFVPDFAHPSTAWLVLAASSTFAGNSTLLASIANLIVAERAAAHGVTLSFGAYMRVGLPITLITLALTIWWFA